MERLEILSTPSGLATLASLPCSNWATLGPLRANSGFVLFQELTQSICKPFSGNGSGIFKLYLLWYSVCVAVVYLLFVFLWILFWGKPLRLAQDGKILPNHCKPFWVLSLGVEMESLGYTLSDLLFVGPCLLFVCVCVSTYIDWSRCLC